MLFRVDTPLFSSTYASEEFGIARAIERSEFRFADEEELRLATFGGNINYREFASADDIRGIFHEHRVELQWLAYFISGDQAVAEACVNDAFVASESHTSVFKEWLPSWAQHATVRSAIDTQRERIKQLAHLYRQPGFVRQVHAPLSKESIQFVIEEADALLRNLDVVCRTVLVICGIQGKSVADAALMLGICKGGVQVAYRKTLDVLEAMSYVRVTYENVSVISCN